jgi:hypothetical protein
MTVSNRLGDNPTCSDLILSAARLDYIADSDLDYVRIGASLG